MIGCIYRSLEVKRLEKPTVHLLKLRAEYSIFESPNNGEVQLSFSEDTGEM